MERVVKHCSRLPKEVVELPGSVQKICGYGLEDMVLW